MGRGGAQAGLQGGDGRAMRQWGGEGHKQVYREELAGP